jgi:hypothetical protein
MNLKVIIDEVNSHENQYQQKNNLKTLIQIHSKR